MTWKLLRTEVNSSLTKQGGYSRKQNTTVLHGAWPMGFYSPTFVGCLKLIKKKRERKGRLWDLNDLCFNSASRLKGQN